MGGGITIPNKHLGYMKNRLVDFLLGVFEHFIFIGRSFFLTWTSPTFSSSHCDSFAMFMRGTCWTKGLGQLLGEENQSKTRNSRSVLESLWDSNKSGCVEFSEVSMFKFSLFFGDLHVQPNSSDVQPERPTGFHPSEGCFLQRKFLARKMMIHQVKSRWHSHHVLVYISALY